MGMNDAKYSNRDIDMHRMNEVILFCVKFHVLVTLA